MHAYATTNANNRAETRREREEIDGSASPKRVVLLRGGPGPGICESDGSPCCALAAAGGYNYMRMMQAAMGVAAAAGAPPPPPPRHAETMVEPGGRGPGIKQTQLQLARPGADGDGGDEHAPPPPPPSNSKQRFTFLGFVVAPPPPPPPPCCSSRDRDHPFEVRTALHPCTACHACTVCVSRCSVGEPRNDRESECSEGTAGGDKAHGWMDRPSALAHASLFRLCAERAVPKCIGVAAESLCGRDGSASHRILLSFFLQCSLVLVLA